MQIDLNAFFHKSVLSHDSGAAKMTSWVHQCFVRQKTSYNFFGKYPESDLLNLVLTQQIEVMHNSKRWPENYPALFSENVSLA